MSAWDIRLNGAVSWGEAVDLAEAALQDTATPLFAAVADWQYPASMVDLIGMSAALGKSGTTLMPWVRPPEQATTAEVEQAHAELLEEIRFKT